jgi:hypothetical protein
MGAYKTTVDADLLTRVNELAKTADTAEQGLAYRNLAGRIIKTLEEVSLSTKGRGR